MSADRHQLNVPGVRPGRLSFQPVRSPYSGDAIAEVEQADGAVLERALDCHEGLFSDRDAWLPLHRRVEVLRRAAATMRSRRQELARLIALEGGKPLTDALVEVDRAVNGVELCGEEAARLHGQQVPMGATASSMGRTAYTVREPVGPVAAISAFNHPLNLVVHQAGPAVAAGCPVVVKPAPATPLSALAFVAILHEAGLPEEWCIALPCGDEVAERLATSARIAFLSFIGSERVGWTLRSRLAPGVRCALEHGGVAPVIVDESADLEQAAPLILKGGYYHAGQVCVSVQRVFAHTRVKDELVDRLAAGAAALAVGDPLLPATEVGPLIRQREVDRVHEWVGEAAGAGATVATGGRPLGHQCYEPTLLVDTPPDTRAMQLEVFGPMVSVVGYEDLDIAVASANSLPFAFQAAVFTRDLHRAERAAARLDATAVMVNDHTAFRVDWMPFGGRRRSGLGMGGIPYAMEDVTQTKMVVTRAG
ncbi:MAG: aldehyde dehydrogenase family protein [Actinomycetota bacterium]|nr:aldehyde dehydrogenase family protein [Actinomycetota bacterium]